MTFDNAFGVAVKGDTLDDIGVDRSLSEEGSFGFFGGFSENVDKFFTDDLAFLLEIGDSGKFVNPDEYTGFYVNIGLDRLVMMRYGVDDVRLFNSADLRFLSQFH